jgi:hypothetical protein
MHHYGNRQLTINETLQFTHEADNPYDPNAIAIRNMNGRKLAYLCKADAKCLAKVIRGKLCSGKVYGKAKYNVEVRARAKGPQQRVAIGFRAHETHEADIKDIFSMTGATIEVK